MAYVSENSVLFTALGQTQKLVAKVRGKTRVSDLSLPERAAAGSCASLFSGLVLCPTELVKCRLQAMREAYTSQGQQPPRIGPYQLTRSDIVNSVVVVNY